MMKTVQCCECKATAPVPKMGPDWVLCKLDHSDHPAAHYHSATYPRICSQFTKNNEQTLV